MGESVLYVLGCVWFSSVISGYVSGSQVGSRVNTCTGYMTFVYHTCVPKYEIIIGRFISPGFCERQPREGTDFEVWHTFSSNFYEK